MVRDEAKKPPARESVAGDRPSELDFILSDAGLVEQLSLLAARLGEEEARREIKRGLRELLDQLEGEKDDSISP